MCADLLDHKTSQKYDLQGYGFLVIKKKTLKLFSSRVFVPVMLKMKFNILSWELLTNKTNYSDVHLNTTVQEFESQGSIYSVDEIYDFTSSSEDGTGNCVVIGQNTEIRSYSGVIKRNDRIEKPRQQSAKEALMNRKYGKNDTMFYLCIGQNGVQFRFSWLVESQKTLWTQSVLRLQVYEWFNNARVDGTLENLPKDEATIMDLTYLRNQSVVHI
ncbi:hypothetical protein RF11_11016 [Thelohanellus kitauei]|uniref:Uncharacterized protein n=1 Tax=Thelohanellus kitauei TaxID=669202 RepID=A0A0C2JW98_THEKT|nr:hypothetical protein RF11_11016 [Thelohanellus kitauei]